MKTYVERLNCKFEILTWNKTNPIPNHANKYLTLQHCKAKN